MNARTPVPEHRTTGAIFTRPEVVAYMMREVMHAGRFGKWNGLRVLEPSCGDGAFGAAHENTATSRQTGLANTAWPALLPFAPRTAPCGVFV